MLNRNQKMNIIFKDADILTVRYHNALNGLHGIFQPITIEDKKKVKCFAGLKTYSEIKKQNKRTPYKQYIQQFIC